NTGGMGAYSPVPCVDSDTQAKMIEIMKRAAIATADEGIDYKGCLYGGFMITSQGPKLLEFNARFGDPETQIVLPRLKSDLCEYLYACACGKLSSLAPMEWDKRCCVGVVLASDGYPVKYAKDKPVKIDKALKTCDDIVVYHAGTKQDAKGKLKTSGGRVFCVSALGDTFKSAQKKSYDACKKVEFSNKFNRTDIAKRAICDVCIIIGSASDKDVVWPCLETLNAFEVSYDFNVISAHRHPEKLSAKIKEATKNDCKIFIAAAGKAAHLAGVIASQTDKPVIAIPVKTSDLGGMDSLLSTVQMPSGVPVATVAINGSKNAALLAVQMLSISNTTLSAKFKDFKTNL
ncbi:MAG: 5-(carboxyamino)imidazole ribonucleotide mutase, partial [Coriobacteriales bacterium]|nr:5-(carboxyamino)imidazole ribonucleotide mutase [Coriobacteriales bacterium]